MAASGIDPLCMCFADALRGGSKDVCELCLARLRGLPEVVLDDAHGTSVRILSDSGLRRVTRRRVLGSLMKRWRFHTRQPI
jgi:hypothetical protein